MCALKWYFKVFVIGLIVRRCELISIEKPNGSSVEMMLWNLTNYALQQSVQGRQGGYGLASYPQRPLGYQQHQQRPSLYPPSQSGAYPGYPSGYPSGNPGYPSGYRPNGSGNPGYPSGNGGYPSGNPGYPSGNGGYPAGNQGYPSGYPSGHPGNYHQQQNPASVMDVLESIAYNDELHCVPKLLCELTSGTRSGTNNQASLLPALPFNLNMDSLLGLFSAFGPTTNPLFLFGRAALLGYNSRDSDASCYGAFPRCPSDPDKLVNYLNNYNGGFFRYFNGAPQPHLSNVNYYRPQQRILTSPTKSDYENPHRYEQYDNFGGGSNRFSAGIKFPGADDGRALNDIAAVDNAFYLHKSPKALTFPGETSGNGQYNFRASKTLTFPNTKYYPTHVKETIPELDFQRPLPNHIASPLIFPTRTGTGELLLDTEEFNKYNSFNNKRNL